MLQITFATDYLSNSRNSSKLWKPAFRLKNMQAHYNHCHF